jgi:hypothetical protein
VGKADDGHHRDRRHPSLFTVLGRVIEWKKGGSVLAAATGVAVNLEATAIRREAGKVSVAGAAGLSGLPGETRQSARWRRKLDYKKSSKEQGRYAEERQIKLSDPCSSFAHCHAAAASDMNRNGQGHGGEIRIRKKFGQRYVWALTKGIFRRLMLFGNSSGD